MDCNLPDVGSAREPEGRQFIGFGHSHLTALQTAYHLWAPLADESPPAVDFIQLLAADFTLPNGHLDCDRLIRMIIDKANGGDRRKEPLKFACFTGNQYQFLSMVRHPRPFDFILDERADWPLQEGAQILPFETVQTLVQRTLQFDIDQLTAISRAIPAPVVAVSSPPPIPDNAFLHQSGNAFWSKAEELGISPPEFRWKFWRLQSLAFERGCVEAGITYLQPPVSAVDENGFMRPQGWHLDGVHGNAWYGARVLDQLASLR